MKKWKSSIVPKVISLAMAAAMTAALPMSHVSAIVVTGTGAEVPQAVKTEYPVDLELPLAEGLTNAKLSIPVDKTKADLDALISGSQIKVSLDRNADRVYLDPALYPNQKAGGDLSTLVAENQQPIFKNVNYASSEKDGKVYLDVAFDMGNFFYKKNKDDTYTADYSVPHTCGGYYMDYTGYFNFAVSDGTNTLGKSDVKVVPYVGFHTMTEVYSNVSDIAAKATANGLYAKEASVGTSTGGRNIPYLIISDNKSSVDKWLNFTDEAETDPSGTLKKIQSGSYNDIRVPVMYSNVHSNETAATDGIMDFAKTLADNKDISYKKLTGLTDAGQTQLNKERSDNNQAVADLVKDKVSFLGAINDDQSVSGKVKIDDYYDYSTKTVKVNDLLDDVFFIIVPSENPDGRTFLSRYPEGGYDLNRDNSFQTTSETAAMQKLIGTYNPVSLTEFHGRINQFQCEPCDPPHEPNFEYDLLSDHLIKGGEELGAAAVANNKSYNSYVIPERDYLKVDSSKKTGTYWDSPWDDMSTSYTPQFAMLQGTCAYTVELPAYNTDATIAVSYGILGQADYIAGEKLGYLTSQTKIFERAVSNHNSDSMQEVGQWLCDQTDAEGAESSVFRPEYTGQDENGNFYPECYIIPMDKNNQKNLPAARDMLQMLSRNDVKVNFAEKTFTYNGKAYPAGTAIISMYQAKRSVANGLLYNGTFINNWTVLYSEGITCFNEARGFDMETVTKPVAYRTIASSMGKGQNYAETTKTLEAVTSTFSGIEGEDVIIKNVSEDSTSAINYILKNGGKIAMITSGDNMGDFICSFDTYKTVSAKYVLTARGVDGRTISANYISKAPTVYINTTGALEPSSTGYIGTNHVTWNAYEEQYGYDKLAMKLMNFNVTTDPSKADVIAGACSIDDGALTKIKSGTPYIGYGSAANDIYGCGGTADTALFGNMVSRDMTTDAAVFQDCLGYVTYPEKTLTNATYINENDNVMYGYSDLGMGYFSKIPDGAKALVKMDGTKTPQEGFIQTYTPEFKAGYDKYINGSVQGFEYKGKDPDGNNINVTLFANSLTNKGHQRDEYAFISNFIFSNMLSGSYQATATSAKKDVTINTNGDVTDAELTKNLITALDDTSLLPGSTITATVPAGVKVEKAVFAEAKAKGINITLKSSDAKATFAFAADKLDSSIIKDMASFDPTVSIGTAVKSIDDILKNLDPKTKKIDVSFVYSGKLPGEAEVTLDMAAAGFTDGSLIYLYYFDPSDNLFSLTDAATITAGKATFTMTHCSEYVASNAALPVQYLKKAPKTGVAVNGFYVIAAMMGLAFVGFMLMRKEK